MELTKNQRLKILRENLELSQDDVAKALGMTKSGYSLIERGKTKLNESHLLTLQKEFKFDIGFILQGDGNSNDVEGLKKENKSLREQLSQAMTMLKELSNTVNMLTSKLGKSKGIELPTLSKSGLKRVSFMKGSITPLAKVG